VTTVANVAVASLVFVFGPTDAQTVGTLTYAPSDASGNLLPSTIPGGGQITIVLTPADLAVFETTVGTTRVKAEAALTNHGLP
jgi:hypothetical protein